LDPLLVVVIGAQQVVSEHPGCSLGFLRIRRARDRIRWRSCVDLRSKVLGIRGDRVSISEGLKEGSLNPWWSRSGEKLNLGFQGTGKNHIFIWVIDLFQVS